MTILFSNSRVSFSRPGSMMQIPGMAYEKEHQNLFTIDVSGEVLNFSDEFQKYSGALALKFQSKSGINFGVTGVSLAEPDSIQEVGFHFQKTIYQYGNVIISSGLHDFIYVPKADDVIKVNDISFFTVFTTTTHFDNYDLSIHFGGGTGKLSYDPQTIDNNFEMIPDGFLGFNLKTPYFQKNGGLDLMMEYDGEGINIGAKLPITSLYTFNFGITHFENLSEFAGESKIGTNKMALQANSPAISFGFTFEVPNLINVSNTTTKPIDIEKQNMGNLISMLRDSILIINYKNKNLFNKSLHCQQKVAVLMDSTRIFHLERQAVYANYNKIMRHISRSLRYFYADEFRQALTEIDMAIKIDPNVALAYARRGAIYYRLGDFQRATMNWNIALKLDPEFTEIYELLQASKDNRLSSSRMEN